jgi:hypothetical protein
MRIRTLTRALVPAIVLTTALGLAPSAFAYGSADHPVAQVEISGNCDNPGYVLCASEVGLGGVWTWAELDVATPGDTSGTMDYTLSFCTHQTDGINGGIGFTGTGSWSTISSLGDAPSDAFPFFDPSKTYDHYYVLDFGEGFVAIVPATFGHYGLNPAPGVSIQTQVAP